MRLGIVAENLMERLILKLNVAPTPLLETQIAFSMAWSIMTGVKLGVFEAAADGPRTGASLARAVSSSSRRSSLISSKHLRRPKFWRGRRRSGSRRRRRSASI